jgi:polygalacturonase
MKRTLSILILATFPSLINSQPVWTNIVEQGADPSGKVKCTSIINNLIDSLFSSGGGTLFFPAGTFLTGPIVMKSNITLYLDAGTVVMFSDDFEDYLPMVPSRWEDIRVRNFKSQIYAYQC